MPLRLTSRRPPLPDVAGRAALSACAAAAAVVSLAGCLRSTMPAREYYRLRPPADATAPPSPTRGGAAPDGARGGGPPLLPVTVESYATPGVYAGPGIVFRVGETRYGTYPNREWAVPLGAMLATLTAESVRAMDAAPPVQDGAGPGAARGLVWRGVVREFEEVDRDAGAPGPRVAAAVRLDAQLVRASDDSVLWQGSAQVERPVTPPDRMTAVVDALSDAARRVTALLVREAEPAMRGAAARAVAARRAP